MRLIIKTIAPKRISNGKLQKKLKLVSFKGITDAMEEERKEMYFKSAKLRAKREIQILICLN